MSASLAGIAGCAAGESTGWHAYVDETESDGRLDPDTYMLAAAMGDKEDLRQARDIMRGLLQPGQRKLHWRDESDRHRHTIIEKVAEAPVEHLAVIYEGRRGEMPERRRRQCLKHLCHALEHLDVTRIVLESRGTKDDQRDRKMIDTLRADKTVSSTLRMDHLPGPAEPLLWLPDAVCGAMTRARTGEPAFMKRIESRLTIVSIGC